MVREDLLQKKYATPDKFSEQLHKVLERMTLNPKGGGCGFLETLYPPGQESRVISPIEKLLFMGLPVANMDLGGLSGREMESLAGNGTHSWVGPSA
jgi:hypothetical protein